MFKNLLSFLLLVILSFSFSFTLARYTSVLDSSGGYNIPILYNDLEFRATYDDGVVYMDWNAFAKDEKFKYYKIIRSNKNADPVYPDDGYIKYSGDINFIEYTDKNPPTGIQYYRICAITYENNRYCSNVEKIYIEYKNTPTICTMEYAPVCGYKNGNYKTYSNKCMLTGDKAYYKYSGECKNKIENKDNKYKIENKYNKYANKISTSLKRKSDSLINNFTKKLDKSDYSNEKKIEKIDFIIKRLRDLESKKPRLSNLINYLIVLLKDKKEIYENDFMDIEDIFGE